MGAILLVLGLVFIACFLVFALLRFRKSEKRNKKYEPKKLSIIGPNPAEAGLGG